MLGLWSDARLAPHFQPSAAERERHGARSYAPRVTPSRKYAATVETIRAAVPNVSITTDVVVGFPSETDADFDQTYALCKQIGFAAMHVFPYSVRPGTSAAHYRGRVGADIKTRRVGELIALSKRDSAAFRNRFLGTTCPVLWEERKEAMGPDWWTGLTDNYIRVVACSPTPLANMVTPARLCTQKKDMVISQVLHYDATGVVTGPPSV